MESPNKKQKVEKPTGESESQAEDAVTLYSYWRSSCSWRVRIALNLKGIKYEYKAIHLVKDGGEQLKADYSTKNPMKEVPSLEIDGHTLGQSMAIIHYLDETRPGIALFPEDAYGRAKVRQLCDIVASDTQPVQNLRVLLFHVAAGGDKMAWGKHWIENGFKGLEAEVAKCGGKYCYGDHVTAADLCLIPQLYNARRFNCDLDQFPTLLAIEKNLVTLPAFEAAHPDKQPDAQVQK